MKRSCCLSVITLLVCLSSGTRVFGVTAAETFLTTGNLSAPAKMNPSDIPQGVSRLYLMVSNVSGGWAYEKDTEFNTTGSDVNLAGDVSLENGYLSFSLDFSHDKSKTSKVSDASKLAGYEITFHSFQNRVTCQYLHLFGEKNVFGVNLSHVSHADYVEEKVGDGYVFTSNRRQKKEGMAEVSYLDYSVGGSYSMNEMITIGGLFTPAQSSSSNYNYDYSGSQYHRGHGSKLRLGVGIHQENLVLGVDLYNENEQTTTGTPNTKGLLFSAEFLIKRDLSLTGVLENYQADKVTNNQAVTIPEFTTLNWQLNLRYAWHHMIIFGFQLDQSKTQYNDDNPEKNRLASQNRSRLLFSFLGTFY